MAAGGGGGSWPKGWQNMQDFGTSHNSQNQNTASQIPDLSSPTAMSQANNIISNMNQITGGTESAMFPSNMPNMSAANWNQIAAMMGQGPSSRSPLAMTGK